jgi:hypothetical protein
VITHKSLGLGFCTLLLLLAPSVHADFITNLQLYDGNAAPTATITYSNASGGGTTTEYVYADPQVSAGTIAPVFYCVDLWHDNYVGSTYQITQVATMAFADSSFSDVDNRIGWLMSQDQSTPDERAAVQLAIWYTVDNASFSMSSGDGTITALYNSLTSFTGYNPAETYTADFWNATHDPSNTLYQNLVSAGPGIDFSLQSVPEPSGEALMSISVLFLAMMYRWRRRR